MTTRSRWLGDVRADINAARARATTLSEDIASLRSRSTEQNRSLTDGEQARIDRLQKGYDRALEDEAGFEDEAKGMIAELGERSENTEGESVITRAVHDAGNERLTGRYVSRSQLEGAALRAVERQKDRLDAPAADRLDALIRNVEDDPAAVGARYLAAVGDPAYARGFHAIMQDPTTAQFSMSREELAEVKTVRDAQRALSLTGASGGFAVPIEIDPTIIGTSNGTAAEFRRVATVKTIATDEWRGVTSGAITAAYAAEATETTDNAPTLAQPTNSTEKAQSFVPFSIEVGMDWPSMRDELGGLLQESKDDLEAIKFTAGSGTNEPFGIITGTTNTVNATTGQTTDAEDVYRLEQALPARYQARASYMASGTITNILYRLVGGASTEPPLVSEDRTRLLGKPLVIDSEMATVTTTGTKFLLYGDFKRYYIIDRIGLQVELIPRTKGLVQFLAQLRQAH